MNPTAVTHFGGYEIENADAQTARIVILPFCYEKDPSYGTGSRDASLHILNASPQLERIDEETLIDWGRLPIRTAEPFYPTGEPEQAVMQMKERAAAVIENEQFLLSLGGDHAVSIGPVMAAGDRYPKIGVLQIDAHLDLRQEWNGSRFNHACVMRRVIGDMRLPAVQVGIRAVAPEEADYIKQQGLEPVFAHDIASQDDRWIDRIVARLPETVYLTIDLDGLDPAVIPATGTPEPGGLTYRQLIGLIKAVGKQRNVVAADITELAKIDGSHISEFTAAKIATKIFVHCI